MSVKSLIVIGASSGGLDALNRILNEMPPHFETPVVIVVHFPRNADIILESVFHVPQGVKILEAQDKMPIESSHIYFAPSGYHLLFEKNKCFALTQDEPVNFSIPSIDVVFESAARVFGKDMTGVLLTGASEDGAKGLLEVQNYGGKTYVQDPSSAAMPVMPEAALKIMKPSAVLPLKEIGETLFKNSNGGSAWIA